MLCLGASGAYIGFMKTQMGNVFSGVLTFYLVATAWTTARRRDGKTGIFDWGALLFALGVVAGLVTYGLETANSQTGSKDGVPPGMFFFLGSVALLAAAGDVRMLVRGGVSGSQRIARHLWRMCFALFIASGSFFMGRQQLFPALVRKTYVLLLLTILPLILMVFWLIRVRVTNAYKRKSVPSGDIVHPLPT
jgi:hypothetical protein